MSAISRGTTAASVAGVHEFKKLIPIKIPPLASADVLKNDLLLIVFFVEVDIVWDFGISCWQQFRWLSECCCMIRSGKDFRASRDEFHRNWPLDSFLEMQLQS